MEVSFGTGGGGWGGGGHVVLRGGGGGGGGGAGLWSCRLGEGEVGGVLDCRVAIWDRGRLPEC